MTYNTEKEFEAVVIAQLVECGWEPDVIRYPTEEELIKNWATILFNNNRGKDQLNGCPLTEGEMAQIIERGRNARRVFSRGHGVSRWAVW